MQCVAQLKRGASASQSSDLTAKMHTPCDPLCSASGSVATTYDGLGPHHKRIGYAPPTSMFSWVVSTGE
jgi:hypothetical protein